MVIKKSSWLSGAGVVLALASLVGEYGFGGRWGSEGIFHGVQVLAGLFLWAGKAADWRFLGRGEFRWSELLADVLLMMILLLGLWVGPVIFEDDLGGSLVRWKVFHFYLLILALSYLGRFSVSVLARGGSPTRVLLISFATIIFVGAILLMLPAAHRGEGLSFTDAMFTSTSATCVTGLVVQDTGGDFTRLGQSVILALIQAGGLGIMIFGALFALLLGSRLSLRESVAMRDIMNEHSPGRVGRVVLFICCFAVVIELIGAVGLYGIWQEDGQRGGQLFQSVFHSVSAFCNAGFALRPDNLESYRGHLAIYGVICPLIILGGLGFSVLENLWMMVLDWRRRKKSGRRGGSKFRLTLHSRIVLVTTGLLLIGGWVGLVVLELIRPDHVSQSGTGAVILDGLFNSVTARTAGFNTAPIENLSAGSKLMLIFLMTVGGSPGSTAGGIKTVTLAVMVLLVYATIKRREQLQVFGRTIPVMIARRAATIMLLYGLVLWLGTLLLTITEHSLGRDMLDLLFEVASALGTVGLSTGVTEHLTEPGKWVIIVAMFVGRLGPLSLLAALTFNSQPGRYDYPKEPLVVG
ncbi:MAG: hypothetical protein JXD22_03845 [Sedimentisphaerales bacterium]|nr:hypothetical protein [Sedimentisphaerales bacterium]